MIQTSEQQAFPWDWQSSHSQHGERYHLLRQGTHEGLCGVRPLCAADAIPVAKVPLVLRCRRRGCRERWPNK